MNINFQYKCGSVTVRIGFGQFDGQRCSVKYVHPSFLETSEVPVSLTMIGGIFQMVNDKTYDDHQNEFLNRL